MAFHGFGRFDIARLNHLRIQWGSTFASILAYKPKSVETHVKLDLTAVESDISTLVNFWSNLHLSQPQPLTFQ